MLGVNQLGRDIGSHTGQTTNAGIFRNVVVSSNVSNSTAGTNSFAKHLEGMAQRGFTQSGLQHGGQYQQTGQTPPGQSPSAVIQNTRPPGSNMQPYFASPGPLSGSSKEELFGETTVADILRNVASSTGDTNSNAQHLDGMAQRGFTQSGMQHGSQYQQTSQTLPGSVIQYFAAPVLLSGSSTAGSFGQQNTGNVGVSYNVPNSHKSMLGLNQHGRNTGSYTGETTIAETLRNAGVFDYETTSTGGTNSNAQHLDVMAQRGFTYYGMQHGGQYQQTGQTLPGSVIQYFAGPVLLSGSSTAGSFGQQNTGNVGVSYNVPNSQKSMLGLNQHGRNTGSYTGETTIAETLRNAGVFDDKTTSTGGTNSNAQHLDGMAQRGLTHSGMQHGGQYQQKGQTLPGGSSSSVLKLTFKPASVIQYVGPPGLLSGSSTAGSRVQQNIAGTYTQSSNSGHFRSPVGGSFVTTTEQVQYSGPGAYGTSYGSGQSGHCGTQTGVGFRGDANTMPAATSFSNAGGVPHPMMGSAHLKNRRGRGRRRHNVSFNSAEERVVALNKRLQQYTAECDNCWWDAFTKEFFEDEANLTMQFVQEDEQKQYSIKRTLIPRFFRSIYEGGVTNLSFQLKQAKEYLQNNSLKLECDQCTMITDHGKPFYTKVSAYAHLFMEFAHDDYRRIKTWHMAFKGHEELVPRSLLATSYQADPKEFNQICKNITKAGITKTTMNFLRLCAILQPMQELMSRHKDAAAALSPRDCLKTSLALKFQSTNAPQNKKEQQPTATKRRKRKVTTRKRLPTAPDFLPTDINVDERKFALVKRPAKKKPKTVKTKGV